MKNANLLLFKNDIYSSDPEDPADHILGLDPMYYYMFSSLTDEELYEIVEPSLISTRKYSKTHSVHLFDPLLTQLRMDIRNKEKSEQSKDNHFNLNCVREVITNEKYPVLVEFTRKFDEWTPERETDLMLGYYYIKFGRLPLVHMIEDLRYEPAIPELREIFLHDSDHRMWQASISALCGMKTTRSMRCLNSLLLNSDLPFLKQYLLVSEIENQHSTILIPGLKRVFEDHYYFYPKDVTDVFMDNTIQQIVLEACAKIPIFKALEILEQGIAHPYDHVERTAYNSIKNWIKLMLGRIQKEKDEGFGFKLAELIKKYDFRIFSGSYEALKKEATSFRNW